MSVVVKKKLQVISIKRGFHLGEGLYRFVVRCADGSERFVWAEDELAAVIELRTQVRVRPDLYDPEVEFVEPEDL